MARRALCHCLAYLAVWPAENVTNRSQGPRGHPPVRSVAEPQLRTGLKHVTSVTEMFLLSFAKTLQTAQAVLLYPRCPQGGTRVRTRIGLKTLQLQGHFGLR